MEFDKSKIFTAITARQAKEGQRGWFGECEDEIVRNLEYEPSSIKEINSSRAYAFRSESDFCLYPFFYPAPEPTYIEEFKAFIKENNIKEGTRVRITRDFGQDFNAYTYEHTGVAGKCGTVSDVGDGYINVCMEGEKGWAWTVPYYAMEVIKEPTYRPYNNDELNDLVGEVLTNKQSGRNKLVTGKPTASEGVNLDGSYINAKDLLASFYRNRDEPCGVREDK